MPFQEQVASSPVMLSMPMLVLGAVVCMTVDIRTNKGLVI